MNVQDIIQTRNFTLIDVREPIELELDGSIEGAINFPLSEIESKINDLKKIDGAKIIFCKAGGRAGSAVQYLTDHGFTDLYNGGGFTMLNYMLQGSN